VGQCNSSIGGSSLQNHPPCEWIVYQYRTCPYTLAVSYGIQLCCPVWFFVPRPQSHQMPLNGIWRWLSTWHKMTIGCWIDEPSALLVSWHGIIARGASIVFAWPHDYIVEWFYKLRFFLVWVNTTLALMGQICKTIHRANMDSVPILTLPIHTCSILWNSIMLARFVFCALGSKTPSVPKWHLEVTFNST